MSKKKNAEAEGIGCVGNGTGAGYPANDAAFFEGSVSAGGADAAVLGNPAKSQGFFKRLTNPPQPDGWMTTKKERMDYGLYFMGQNFFYTIVTSFLTTYLLMQGIALVQIAGVMLAVKVWDAINDAIFGGLIDKVKFKGKNKFLPWLRISVVFIPIATVLIFWIPSAAATGVKLAWFAIAYLLWDTAYTVCDVPIFGMVTTMTSNLGERNSLMSRGRIFGGIGGGFTALLMTVLASEKVGVSFGWIAIILAVLGFAVMLPICIRGKERNITKEEAEQKFSMREMFRYLKKNKYLLIYYAGFILSGALATHQTLGMFVAYYLFGSALFNLILTLLTMVPLVIFALFTPAILKRVDKFKFFMACQIFMAVFWVLTYIVGYDNVGLFIALSVLKALPLGATGIMMFMFTPDCAEYGQYKTGTDARGITFAIQTFSGKITAAISSSMGLFILGFFGWIEITATDFADLQAQNIAQPASALQGLWVVYTLIPAIGIVLAICAWAFYKLRDKDVQVMAKFNAGEITREEAEGALGGRYDDKNEKLVKQYLAKKESAASQKPSKKKDYIGPDDVPRNERYKHIDYDGYDMM